MARSSPRMNGTDKKILINSDLLHAPLSRPDFALIMASWSRKLDCSHSEWALLLLFRRVPVPKGQIYATLRITELKLATVPDFERIKYMLRGECDKITQALSYR